MMSVRSCRARAARLAGAAHASARARPAHASALAGAARASALADAAHASALAGAAPAWALAGAARASALAGAALAACLLVGCASRAAEPRVAAAAEPAVAAAAAAPERFGAGVFSTPAWDFFVALAPGEQRALLCRADDAFERYAIWETRREGGAWTPPVQPAAFAIGSNADPHLTVDGTRVFFISNRPGPGETGEQPTFAIWTAALGGDGQWDAPTRLPAPVNAAGSDAWSPSVAANGNLYFGAERPGGHGGSDLWRARLVDGVYQPLENLGGAINTAANEVEPWIAPDESYLIFSSVRRPDSLGSYDLYVSRWRDGAWQPAQHLPAPINSSARDFNQSVSPDGRWLYFSSTRPGGDHTGDIYRVPLSAALPGVAPAR